MVFLLKAKGEAFIIGDNMAWKVSHKWQEYLDRYGSNIENFDFTAMRAVLNSKFDTGKIINRAPQTRRKLWNVFVSMTESGQKALLKEMHKRRAYIEAQRKKRELSNSVWHRKYRYEIQERHGSLHEVVYDRSSKEELFSRNIEAANGKDPLGRKFPR